MAAIQAGTKLVGYARISDRGATGGELSLDRQKEALKAWALAQGCELLAIFTDAGVSGRKTRRDGFDKAIAMCALHNATLLAHSFDRIARDRKVQERLQFERVAFRVLDVPEMSEQLLGLVSLMSDMYSQAISSKMKAYHASRKAKAARGECTPHPTPSFKPSREHGLKTLEKARKVRVERAELRASYVLDEVKELVESGASLRTIAGELNTRGITTSRGCKWTPAAVARVLKRA